MIHGKLTKQEMAQRLERLEKERPYLSTHFLTKEDFAPFFQADQVWYWETAELPVAEASAWLRRKLEKLRRKKQHVIGRCLLCLWASAAHNLGVLEQVIASLSWEVENPLFDLLFREDLEETKLGLLLLVSMDARSTSDERLHHSPAVLPLSLGWAQNGHALVGDMEQLRHLLIAGRTSTGLGDYIGSLLQPLLHQDNGQKLRLLLIPSSGGKLLRYADDPHLLFPVPANTQAAGYALQWALMELEQRRRIFSIVGAQDIQTYNALADTETMPTVLVVLEELADLMKTAAHETEKTLCQIAKQGHTAGIHLIVATSHPVPQVITGLLKFDFVSRIAFAANSIVESRVMIDVGGAEHLGEGELLYCPLGARKPIRLQVQ